MPTTERGWEQKERVGFSFSWLIFINYLDNNKELRIKIESERNIGKGGERKIVFLLFLFLHH